MINPLGLSLNPRGEQKGGRMGRWTCRRVGQEGEALV